MIEPVTFGDDGVALLDQRQLPHQETWIELDSPRSGGDRDPGYGRARRPGDRRAAGFGMALAARAARGLDEQAFRDRLDAAAETLARHADGRQLAWAVERVRDTVRGRWRTARRSPRRPSAQSARRSRSRRRTSPPTGRWAPRLDAGAGRGARADALQRGRAGDRWLRDGARRRPRRRRGREDSRGARRRDAALLQGRGSPRGSCRRTGSR